MAGKASTLTCCPQPGQRTFSSLFQDSPETGQEHSPQEITCDPISLHVDDAGVAEAVVQTAFLAVEPGDDVADPTSERSADQAPEGTPEGKPRRTPPSTRP